MASNGNYPTGLSRTDWRHIEGEDMEDIPDEITEERNDEDEKHL